MYIWNKNGCALVSEDDYRKEIMYISDEGLVVYSNSDVINDEGSIAGTAYVLPIPAYEGVNTATSPS